MVARNTLKHRFFIKEIGRIQADGTAIEVYSRGGSLFGFKKLVDEFSKQEKLGIKTVYNNDLGAGRMDVILADRNAEEAADKLDSLFISRKDYSIRGYFSDALAAAEIPSDKKTSA